MFLSLTVAGQKVECELMADRALADPDRLRDLVLRDQDLLIVEVSVSCECVYASSDAVLVDVVSLLGYQVVIEYVPHGAV